MGPRDAYQAYKTAEVDTLSQRELLVRLYQGAERFIGQGLAAMREGRHEDCNTYCQKSKRIFLELLSTLNFEQGGEIAVRLRDLYLFFVTELVESNLRKEPDRLAGILPVVVTLREGWEGVPDEYANVSSAMPTGGRHSLSITT